MRPSFFWALPALALAAACSKQAEPPAETVQLTFHEVMKDQVDKHADEVWEITNRALNETAGIDPKLMSDAQWTEVAERAETVQKAALTIAAMDPIVVARPGVKISDEGLPGGHTAAMVQARVDKDPQHLRDMANVLAAHMGQLAAAARAHDAAKLGPLVDQLDGVCEDCHLDFWYPDQKELVNQYRNESAAEPKAGP